MANGEVKVCLADNFKLYAIGTMPTDETILSRPDVRFDLRTRMLTYNLNTYTWDWYFNYIESMRSFVNKNPQGYSTYMLDAGYLPVIYLPIDTTDVANRSALCVKYYNSLLRALMSSGIEYVSMQATTFMPFRISYGNVTDAWVSKMDAAKVLNKDPNLITSDDVIREVIKYVTDL